MTITANFATEIHRQHEQEMARDLERRRIAAARVIKEFNDRIPSRRRWATVGSWLNRLQASVGHQPASSRAAETCT